MNSSSEINSPDSSSSSSLSPKDLCPAIEKVYETLNKDFTERLGKIKGLIKYLPKSKQTELFNKFYEKLISSSSVKTFLEILTKTVTTSSLDKMTGLFEIFTRYHILPNIKVVFNESSSGEYSLIDSHDFFSQFYIKDSESESKPKPKPRPKPEQLYDMERIDSYLNLIMSSILFVLEQSDQEALLLLVSKRISFHERQDNRELYAYGPLQRRLDSLARILSLHSNYSACVALTIHESRLIISANATDEIYPNAHILFFRKRIEKVREFLNQFYFGRALIFKTDDEVDPVTLSCFEQGGQLYDWDYVYLEKLFTQNFKTCVEELYNLLNSPEYGGVGVRIEYFIKDAYKLAVTAYMMRHGIEHPSESILALIEKKSSPQTPLISPKTPIAPMPHNFITANDTSPQNSKYEFLSAKPRASSPVYLSESTSMKSRIGSHDWTFSSIENPTFASMHASPSSFTEDSVQMKLDSISPSDSFSSIDNSIFASVRASSPVYIEESMRIKLGVSSSSPRNNGPAMAACSNSSPNPLYNSCSTPTPVDDPGVENIELRQISKQEFNVLLGAPSQFNVTYLSFIIKDDKGVSVLIHDDDQEVKIVPLNTKHNGKVTDIHAEQLIMVGYLEHYKKVNLSDLTIPKVHIGLSKFACATCDEVKSRFNAVVFTGRSQVHFPNVANLRRQDALFFKENGCHEENRARTPTSRKPRTPSASSSQERMGGKPIQEQAGLTAAPVSPMLSPASKKAKSHQNLLVTELFLSANIDAIELSSNVSSASQEIGCKRKLLGFSDKVEKSISP
jgi:hypothetical protein